MIFSSTGRRPASFRHGVVSVMRLSVRSSMHTCVCKLFLQKTSPQKLLTGFLRHFTGSHLRWSPFKFLQIIVFYEEFWLPWRPKWKTLKKTMVKWVTHFLLIILQSKMNLQSFQASPREMITFVRLLKSSMSHFPLVLCVISAKMHTITTSKFC